jgi:hypothetical protein
MHWAIHCHTAQEIIAERANRDKPYMGLTSFGGTKPRKNDVTIAKNYLTKDELEQLNLIVDQYLSFAEFQARQRKPMTMQDWARKLDDFLKLNERDILKNAGKISKQLGEQIALKEYEAYTKKQSREYISDFDKISNKLLDAPKRKKQKKGKKDEK